MPEGLWQVVGFVSLGFVLGILELFVPGGILGFLGILAMGYGCYLAFGLSSGWGMGSVILSVLFTWTAIRLFVRSRAARNLVLDEQIPDWQATETGLEELVGKEGRTLSTLRPAGLADIDGERVDVVADSEYIDVGVRVRVSEVEGNRVVVEALSNPPDDDGPVA